MGIRLGHPAWAASLDPHPRQPRTGATGFLPRVKNARAPLYRSLLPGIAPLDKGLGAAALDSQGEGPRWPGAMTRGPGDRYEAPPGGVSE